MPGKTTRIIFVSSFIHRGATYQRFRRTDTGKATDVKVRNPNGTWIYTNYQALQQARRRLTGIWAHAHLVK